MYGIDSIFERVDNTLDVFLLGNVDLSLDFSMLMSSEMQLASTGLIIAEVVKRWFIFTVSLLGAIIQDGGKRERSDNDHIPLPHPRKRKK